MLNKRRQVLLQDDIQCSQSLQWRMHTNATIDPQGTLATLDIGGKKMQVEILNAPSGATFAKADPVRYSDDPALPQGQTDQENAGVSVLTIDLPAGQYNLQVSVFATVGRHVVERLCEAFSRSSFIMDCGLS
jgi:hypothetical protein